MNIPNLAFRYQAVRSSSEPRAHAKVGAIEREVAARATFRNSRRSCEQAPIRIFSNLGRPISSIEMEYLFHLCPPLPFFSCRHWLLHRLHDGPPFLRLCMRRHLVPVTLHVASVVFEITEEDSVFEV